MSQSGTRPLGSTIALLATAVGLAAHGQEVFKPIDPNGGWKLASKTNSLTIYSRIRAGSPIKEFKASGEIDAPTHVVYAVIADFENYPRFMPYTAESRLIKREVDAIVGYQRLSPKICADRDYILRVRTKSWPTPDGVTFVNWWTPANDVGLPEKPGVVRVKICEGGWLLKPRGPNKTRATYSVYTDTGGLIPPFIANHVSQIGITRLFEAVRKQVRDPKHARAIR
jgi:Polyketide cyclase / dehydrase and lipid transport